MTKPTDKEPKKDKASKTPEPIADTILTAQDIFNKLGAGDFVILTGARDVIGTYNSLRMRLPSIRAKLGATHAEIRANDAGFYDMRTLRAINGTEPRVIEYKLAVPPEDLRKAFDEISGLGFVP